MGGSFDASPGSGRELQRGHRPRPRSPTARADIVRVQDVGLSGADDPVVLEWAAHEHRVVLTHDVSTLVGFALERVAAKRPMPGVFVARSSGSVGSAIEDRVLLSECSVEGEWEGRVTFLPF